MEKRKAPQGKDDSASASPSPSFLGVALLVLAFLLSLAVQSWIFWNNHSPTTTRNDDNGYCSATTNSNMDNLLTGYKILHHTLGKESQLSHLQLLRNVTFRKPSNQELQRLFTVIHQTCQQRKTQLEALWRQHEPLLSPYRDAPVSDIGDAIQTKAEQKGTVELLLPKTNKTTTRTTTRQNKRSSSNNNNQGVTNWSVRFYFLQAQATRMIAAVASSTAAHESNTVRTAWLDRLATEFEDLREQLVSTLTDELMMLH